MFPLRFISFRREKTRLGEMACLYGRHMLLPQKERSSEEKIHPTQTALSVYIGIFRPLLDEIAASDATKRDI